MFYRINKLYIYIFSYKNESFLSLLLTYLLYRFNMKVQKQKGRKKHE